MTIKKFLPIAISIVILIMGVFFFMINHKENKANLASQAATITKLKNNVSIMEAATDTGAIDSKARAAGLDAERVASGHEEFKKALAVMCDWKDKASYEAMRKELQVSYNVNVSDDLLTHLLPEQGTSALGFNVEGVDNGVVIVMKDVQSYVIGITGSDYEYLAQSVLSVKAADGTVTDISVAFTYTVAGNGSLSNIIVIGIN